jgi:hypothetical protein
MQKFLTGRLQSIDDRWFIIYNTLQDEGYKLGEISLGPHEESKNKIYQPFKDGKTVQFYIDNFWETGLESPIKVAILNNKQNENY